MSPLVDNSPAGALAAGGAVALAALGGLMRYRHAAWTGHVRRIGTADSA
jgi:hypothetical protein